MRVHTLERVFRDYPTLTGTGLVVLLYPDSRSSTYSAHYSEGLHSKGYTRPPRGACEAFNEALQKGREELRDRLPAINLIASWLLDCPKLKAVNRRRSSYGLKHLCERHMLAPDYCTYVSNGEFIAAAVLAGFTLYSFPHLIGDINCAFNMSERWLKEQAARKVAGDYIDLNKFAENAAAWETAEWGDERH